MTSNIQIDTVDDGSCSVVHVQGDVDMKTSPEVRAVILDLIENQGQQRVILDLSGAQHVDSSGVASFIEGLREAKKRNKRFILCGLNEAPRHVLDVTCLNSVFEITPTVEEALGPCRRKAAA
jgi:anti-sigma B factor antagonist